MRKEIIEKIAKLGNIYTFTHDVIVGIKEGGEIYLINRPLWVDEKQIPKEELPLFLPDKVVKTDGGYCYDLEGGKEVMINKVCQKGDKWFIIYFLEGKFRDVLYCDGEEVYDKSIYLLKKWWY